MEDDKAQQFLQHCDGNLEEAVQLFFSTGGNLDNRYGVARFVFVFILFGEWAFSVND